MDSGCRVGISIVVHKHNIDSLSDVCEWVINEIKPLSIGVNIPHYTQKYKWDIPQETLANEFVKLFNLSKKYNIFIDQVSRILSPIICEKLRYKDCSACGNKVVVYPDENISNCIVKYLYTGGNDLDIWNKSSPVNTPECKECFAIGVCGGGCKFDGHDI